MDQLVTCQRAMAASLQTAFRELPALRDRVAFFMALSFDSGRPVQQIGIALIRCGVLESLSPLQLLVAASIVFGAFVVRGMSGFGAGMIGIPLLAFLMPVHTAVAMFGLMVLFLFVFLSIRDWGEVVK